MHTYENFETLITSKRQGRENFKTLLSCVVPRPIAFVSTISADGEPNLAPFSFFNAVGSAPPAIIFSPCTKANGSSKDTILNLRQIGECVVNVVPHAIHSEMNHASVAFPPEVNEFNELEPMPTLLIPVALIIPVSCPIKMQSTPVPP